MWASIALFMFFFQNLPKGCRAINSSFDQHLVDTATFYILSNDFKEDKGNVEFTKSEYNAFFISSFSRICMHFE